MHCSILTLTAMICIAVQVCRLDDFPSVSVDPNPAPHLHSAPIVVSAQYPLPLSHAVAFSLEHVAEGCMMEKFLICICENCLKYGYDMFNTYISLSIIYILT